jgi:hypothetical protein
VLGSKPSTRSIAYSQRHRRIGFPAPPGSHLELRSPVSSRSKPITKRPSADTMISAPSNETRLPGLLTPNNRPP